MIKVRPAGLARRSPHPTDGRAVLVEAAEESRDLREAVMGAWAELERIAEGALSRDGLDELQACLSRLEANLMPEVE